MNTWQTFEQDGQLIANIDRKFCEHSEGEDFDLDLISPPIDFNEYVAFTIMICWNEEICNLFIDIIPKTKECIKLKETNSDTEQIEIVALEQYKQIINIITNIYYSAQILYHKKQNNFALLEMKFYAIEEKVLDYLNKELDNKEAELKNKQRQITIVEKNMQTANELGSAAVNYIGEKVLSIVGKVKSVIGIGDKAAELKNELPSEADGDATYNSVRSKSTSNNHNGRTDLPNTDISNPSLSNSQKCKRMLKAMFSEKIDYAFLACGILGIAAILAYFVPGGLRDLVSPEKQRDIDITIAIGAPILIVLCFAALVYSAYNNVPDPSLEGQLQLDGQGTATSR